MKRVFTRLIKILVTFILWISCLTGQTSIKAPPGFEKFLGKQSTIADIFYGGSRVGESLVSYDLENVWFEEPKNVLAMLVDVKQPAPELLAALQHPLSRNTHKTCSTMEKTSCSVLRPETLEIVFDERKFRIDIFVNSDYRKKPVLHEQRYLEFKPSSFSTVHNISGSLSRNTLSGRTEQSRSFIVNSLMSYNHHRIKGSFVQDSESDGKFTHLSYQNEGTSSEYEIGFMQSLNRYASLITPQYYYGFSWRNHLKHRLDLSSQLGSEITLFLDNDSKVEVFRGNELLSIQYKESGNQLIDTEYYPEGAYFIDIRITDSIGLVRTKRQYFVKSNQLPPIDETLWMLELGMTDNSRYNNQSSLDATYFFRAERVTRLNDNIGYSLGTIVNPSQSFWYSAWDYYWRSLQLRQEVGLSDLGYWQYITRLRMDINNRFNLILSNYKNSLGDLSYFGEVVSSPNEQRQLSISIPLESMFVSYNYQDMKGNFGDETRQGINLRYRFLADRSGAWTVLFDWIKEVDSQSINLRMQYNFMNENGQAIVENGHRVRIDDDIRSNQSNMRLNLNGNFYQYGPMRWSSGVGAFKQGEESLITIRNSLNAPYLLVDTAMQHGQGSQQEFSSDYINFSTNVVTTQSGLFFGGQRGQSSGVVIDFDLPKGYSNESTFVVFVDNIPVKRVYPTSPIFLPVPSHRKIKLRIKQEKGNLLKTDFKEKEISLLPGQVDHVSYKLSQIFVVVGQLLSSDFKPLMGVSVGAANSFHLTDQEGWFQIEVSDLDKLEFFRNEQRLCSIDLDSAAIDGDVIWLDSIYC